MTAQGSVHDLVRPTVKHIGDICDVSLYTSDVILLEFFRHAISEEEDVLLAQGVFDTVKYLMAEHSGTTFNIIFCVTHLGNSSQHAGHHARVIYRKMYEHPQINKMAVVHKNSFIGTLIGYFVGMLNVFNVKKDALKYFSKREEAVAWIASDL